MASWPDKILLVRHGQSAGNVAAELAETSGLSAIDIDLRDVDVALSELGQRQAHAVGVFLARQPRSERPTVILTSPYVRARQTSAIIVGQWGESRSEVRIEFDERLREREFGLVDRLTKKGIRKKYPYQAELHARLGKFYYRAPGGENWCDVILRLRSVVDSLARDYAGERVMIVCHTVVVLCFRYIFEKLNEEQILKIDKETRLANCSITSYFGRHDRGGGELELDKFNFVVPLEEAGEAVTTEKDKPEELA